ncbi:MAG: glycosyltransferase family A protein [Candidatus Competibacter sp.]
MSSSAEIVRHRDHGAPVDCHVLHFGEPEIYLDQCLASLEAEPVNIHIVRGGFPGNIGAARAYALSLGSAPYWTFVDADDWLASGIVERCTRALDRCPDLVGVYTDYQAIGLAGERLYRASKRAWSPLLLLKDCWAVLHYHQYRREPMRSYLNGLAQIPCYEEAWIAGTLSRHGDFLHLAELGYYKRENGQSARLQDAQLLRRVYRDISPALMDAQKRWIGTKRAA